MAPGRAGGSPPTNTGSTASLHDNEAWSRKALAVNNPALISFDDALGLSQLGFIKPWELGSINTHGHFADMDTSASLAVLQQNIRNLAASEYKGKVSLEDIANGQSLTSSGLSRVFTTTTPRMKEFVLDTLKGPDDRIDLDYVETRFGEFAKELKLKDGAKITEHKFDVNDDHQLYILTSMLLKTVHRENLKSPLAESLFREENRKKPPLPDTSDTGVAKDIAGYRTHINTAISKNELFYDGYFSDKFLPSGAVSLKNEALLSSPDFIHANRAYVDLLIKKTDALSAELGLDKDPEFAKLYNDMVAADAKNKDAKTLMLESYWTPEKAAYVASFMDLIRGTNMDSVFREKFREMGPGRVSADQYSANKRAEVSTHVATMDQTLRVNEQSYVIGLMAEVGTQKKAVDYLNKNSPVLAGQPLPSNVQLKDPRFVAAIRTIPEDQRDGFKKATGISTDKMVQLYDGILTTDEIAKVEEESARLSLIGLSKFINRNFVGESRLLKDKIAETGDIEDPGFLKAYAAVTKKMQGELLKPEMLEKLGDHVLIKDGRAFLKIPAVGRDGKAALVDSEGKPVLLAVELTADGDIAHKPAFNLLTGKYYVGDDGSNVVREARLDEKTGLMEIDPVTKKEVACTSTPIVLNPAMEAIKILKDKKAVDSGLLTEFGRLTGGMSPTSLSEIEHNLASVTMFEKVLGVAAVEKMSPDELRDSLKTMVAKQMLSDVITSNTLPGVKNFNIDKDPANITDNGFIKAAHDTFAKTEQLLSGRNTKLLAAAFSPAEKTQIEALSRVTVSGQYNAHTGELLKQLRDRMISFDPVDGKPVLNPEFIDRAREANPSVTPEYLHTMAGIVNNLSNVYVSFGQMPEKGVNAANLAMKQHHDKVNATASVSSSPPATVLSASFLQSAPDSTIVRPEGFEENPALAAERKSQFASNKDNAFDGGKEEPALTPGAKPAPEALV